MKKEFSTKDCEELLNTLKARFEKNTNRHKDLEWPKVETTQIAPTILELLGLRPEELQAANRGHAAPLLDLLLDRLSRQGLLGRAGRLQLNQRTIVRLVVATFAPFSLAFLARSELPTALRLRTAWFHNAEYQPKRTDRIFEPFYAGARFAPGVVSGTSHAIVSKSGDSLSSLLCPAYILRDTAACLGQTPDINPENRDPE